MSGSRLPWRSLAVVTIVITVISVLLAKAPGAESSSLSRGPKGWLGLAEVLEGDGATIERLGGSEQAPRALEPGPGAIQRPKVAEGGVPGDSVARALRSVRLIGFPMQVGLGPRYLLDLQNTLREGGSLVIGYSGGRLSFREDEILSGLGLELERHEEKVSLNPLLWRRRQKRGDQHQRGSSTSANLPAILTTSVLPQQLIAPSGSEVLYRGAEGRAVAVRYPSAWSGEIVALPASAFQNAFLEENLAVVLWLRDQFGDSWTFDETGHGLASSRAAVLQRRLRLDLLFVHGVLLYALVVLALAWRFGPSWGRLPQIEDSHRDFLIGVGALHHRLGHHTAAAGRLIEAATEYDPLLEAPASVPDIDFDGKKLLQLARRLTRKRLPSVRVKSPASE